MAAKEKPARGESLARNGKEIFRDFFLSLPQFLFFGGETVRSSSSRQRGGDRKSVGGREGREIRSFVRRRQRVHI